MPPAAKRVDRWRLSAMLAEAPPLDDLDRPPRDRGDAVIALLAVDRDMAVAERCEGRSSGNSSSGHLVSCRQSTSGARSTSRRSTIGRRSRTELMFQVAMVKGIDGVPATGKSSRKLPAAGGKDKAAPYDARRSINSDADSRCQRICSCSPAC